MGSCSQVVELLRAGDAKPKIHFNIANLTPPQPLKELWLLAKLDGLNTRYASVAGDGSSVLESQT
ncbi:MAG: hypothetical protein AMXMBFR84_48500 [Candidatus Hydrogenedentota bacterium]